MPCMKLWRPHQRRAGWTEVVSVLKAEGRLLATPVAPVVPVFHVEPVVPVGVVGVVGVVDAVVWFWLKGTWLLEGVTVGAPLWKTGPPMACWAVPGVVVVPVVLAWPVVVPVGAVSLGLKLSESGVSGFIGPVLSSAGVGKGWVSSPGVWDGVVEGVVKGVTGAVGVVGVGSLKLVVLVWPAVAGVEGLPVVVLELKEGGPLEGDVGVLGVLLPGVLLLIVPLSGVMFEGVVSVGSSNLLYGG